MLQTSRSAGLVTTLALCLVPTALLAQAKTAARTPVLVELFTSEGCSSCPPADALLAKLLQQQPVPNADIIVLEEHVDYWDSLGWHDRFSAHQYTDRQTGYAHALRIDSDYTPQMVVDGTDQFVGNDSARALRSIAQASHTPKLALTFSSLMLDGNRITGSVSLPAGAAPPPADLYAVLVDQMASTDVKRGENGGRTLHHVSVVRSMQPVGSLADVARGPLPFSINVPKDSSAATTRVILFAQRPGQGTVVAATSMATPQPATQQASTR